MYEIEIANIDEFKTTNSKKIIHDGTPIAIFKIENEFFAIDNRCPHRGASLGDGKLTGNVISCPWHSWKFSIKSGIAIENLNCSVKTFSVFIENDIVKLKYEPEE
tara:strand:- start:282 stop:596 length:315 start_codon:yes stop_codon:yes gene_type:complete